RHGSPIEDKTANFSDTCAGNLDLHRVQCFFQDGAQTAKVRICRSGKFYINDFAAGELFDDAFEVSIEHDAPVIDKNDALAQRFDVLHVVTSQQDGGLASRVVVLEEFAHGFLADDIE